MKSILLGGVAVLALGMTGALAQLTPTPNPAPAASASTNGGFIDRQAAGTFRAPKLVGVAVYDSGNHDVGKIADLLLDKDGTVKTVVISVGGFLGIGTKDVALPYSAVHWQTEQRTAATNDTTMGGTAPNSQKTMSKPQTEAYQGYPDRAVIDMTQAQLKSAPEFTYASSNGGATPAKPQ